MSKCPGCSAPLIYDAKGSRYVCEYCKSEFPAKDIAPETEKKVIYEYRQYDVQNQKNPAKKGWGSAIKKTVCLFLAFFLAIMGAAAFSTDHGIFGLVMFLFAAIFLYKGIKKN